MNGVIKTSETLGRSEDSLAFEALWRSIPKEGLVPQKSEFRPAFAPRLLPKIVLTEAQLQNPPSLHVRLIGTSIRERLQRDITGTDYLSLAPEQSRSIMLRAARAIVERPCGLWLVTVADFPHGYPLFTELTIFPMAGSPGGLPIMFTLVNMLESSPMGLDATGHVVRPDGDCLQTYIDVGAGVPEISGN